MAQDTRVVPLGPGAPRPKIAEELKVLPDRSARSRAAAASATNESPLTPEVSSPPPELIDAVLP